MDTTETNQTIARLRAEIAALEKLRSRHVLQADRIALAAGLALTAAGWILLFLRLHA